MEDALAGTCVFVKQSPGPLRCDPRRLEEQVLSPTGAPLLPKLRGQIAEFLEGGSLNHLRALTPAYLCRIAVRSTYALTCEAFLGSVRHRPFAGSCDPFGIGSRLPGRICLPRNAYHLASDNPPTRRTACSCVPPQARTDIGRYGNIDPFPIGYAFRPHLRDRLTLS